MAQVSKYGAIGFLHFGFDRHPGDVVRFHHVDRNDPTEIAGGDKRFCKKRLCAAIFNKIQ